MKQLWVEKYRPSKITDYVWKDAVQKAQMEGWAKNKEIPHLLFSGSPGTGKTTAIKMLINELGVHPSDVLTLDYRKRGVDDSSRIIMNFCMTVPFGEFKVVFIDEADNLTFQSQQVLRGLMEQYSDFVRFALSCNYQNKILPAIRSRCQGFHMDKLDMDQFIERAATILINENVEFELDDLDTIVTATYPDLRKCINTLEQLSIDGKLTLAHVDENSTEDYRMQMVGLIKAGKISEARAIACSKVRPDEMDEMFRWMYDNIKLWGDTPEKQDRAVIIIRNGIVNHSMVADTEINLAATLIELTSIE